MRQGFTLVELLVVVAVLLLIAGAAIPIYGNLQVSSQLQESSAQLIATLRTAHVQSVARLNNANHGVYFEINPGADHYILYQGTSYAARDASYDRTTTLDEGITLAASLTGSSTDVNFSLGIGTPSATGTLTLTHAVSGIKTIVINSFSMVDGN